MPLNFQARTNFLRNVNVEDGECHNCKTLVKYDGLLYDTLYTKSDPGFSIQMSRINRIRFETSSIISLVASYLAWKRSMLISERIFATSRGSVDDEFQFLQFLRTTQQRTHDDSIVDRKEHQMDRASLTR